MDVLVDMNLLVLGRKTETSEVIIFNIQKSIIEGKEQFEKYTLIYHFWYVYLIEVVSEMFCVFLWFVSSIL